jgi:hypothetical protein
MKALVSKKIERTTKFMGEDIKIKKLSVAEVLDIQAKAKEADKEETAGFDLLKTVIRLSVADAEDLTDEDFNAFPMDELSKLSNEIMKFSGMLSEGK